MDLMCRLHRRGSGQADSGKCFDMPIDGSQIGLLSETFGHMAFAPVQRQAESSDDFYPLITAMQ